MKAIRTKVQKVSMGEIPVLGTTYYVVMSISLLVNNIMYYVINCRFHRLLSRQMQLLIH